jgi:riboflavin kinase/FMN adenylyltransferase
MKVFKSLDNLPKWNYPVLTQGTFDGVHLGHKALISKINELARQNDGESVLLTYYPHPRLVIYPEDNELKLLNTLDEKIELLEDAGIQNLIVLEFTKQLSSIGARLFIENIVHKAIGAKKMVVGYDHRFGKNREGSIDDLKTMSGQYGFDVEEISVKMMNDISISSTKIRKSLQLGEVEKANELIGRPYSISGTIVEGMKLGRELGFPTANLYVEENFKLIPKNGVYSVRVSGQCPTSIGMMSIGHNPTVDGKGHSIEIHLLDFEGDLYDKQLKVEFLSWIRDEEKFVNLQALKDQLIKDKIHVEKQFK